MEYSTVGRSKDQDLSCMYVWHKCLICGRGWRHGTIHVVKGHW